MDYLASFLFKDVVMLTVVMFFVLCALAPGLLTIRRISLFWLAAVIGNTSGWFVGGEHSVVFDILRFLTGVWAITALLTVALGCPLVLLKFICKAFFWVYAKVRSAETGDEKRVDQGRRRFLTSGALLAVSTGISVAGTLETMSDFKVLHEEIVITGLPENMEGFRIGQLTDIHVGNFVAPEELAAAVAALNTANVDLQVMTGDILDDVKYLKPTFDALESCTAKYGMLAVIGNHEKWLCLEEVLAQYQQRAANGVLRLLQDESTVLQHKGTNIRIVGVDYPMEKGGSHSLPLAQRNAYMQASMEKAFANTQKDELIICLSHHPDFFPFAANGGARLTLAGHTHGGQVALFGRPIFALFDYMLGWYQRGENHLYVSGGLGQWLPFRIGIPKSITIITLRAAKRT